MGNLFGREKETENDDMIELALVVSNKNQIPFNEAINKQSSVSENNAPALSIEKALVPISKAQLLPSKDPTISYSTKEYIEEPTFKTKHSLFPPIPIANLARKHDKTKTINDSSQPKELKKSFTILDFSYYILCKIMLFIPNDEGRRRLCFTCKKIRKIKRIWFKEIRKMNSNCPDKKILIVSGIIFNIEKNCGLSERYGFNDPLTEIMLRSYIRDSTRFPKFQLFFQITNPIGLYSYATFGICTLQVIRHLLITEVKTPFLEELMLMGDYRIDHSINENTSDLIYKVVPHLKSLDIFNLRLYHLNLRNFKYLKIIRIKYTPYNESDRHFIKLPNLDGSSSLISLPPFIEEVKVETNCNMTLKSEFTDTTLKSL
jgi:hypothetical protein